jgi:hypothetical protein
MPRIELLQDLIGNESIVNDEKVLAVVATIVNCRMLVDRDELKADFSVSVNSPLFGHKRTTAAIPEWRASYLCDAR